MDFISAIKICLNKYIDPKGRASRSEYWYFFLFTSLVTGVLNGYGNEGPTVLGSLVSLALFLPTLMVLIRRLHDREKSGWWVLFVFLPLIGLIVLLIQTVQSGTVGDNQYGADPVDYDDDNSNGADFLEG